MTATRTTVETKRYTKGEHWPSYWNSLSESGRDSLRRKAKWEHMTLMAVAMEWGAVAELSQAWSGKEPKP